MADDNPRLRLELERQLRDVDELIRGWEAFQTIVARDTSRLLAAIQLEREKFASPKERREYVDRFLGSLANARAPVLPNSLRERFLFEIQNRPEVSELVGRSLDDDLAEWRRQKDYAAPILERFKKECEDLDGDIREASSLVVRATKSDTGLLEQTRRSLDEGKKRLLDTGCDHFHEAIDNLVPFVEALGNDAHISTSALLELAHSIREDIVEELIAIGETETPVEAKPTDPELSTTYIYRKNQNRTGWWEIQFETDRPWDFPEEDGFYLIYLLLSSPRKWFPAEDLRADLSKYKLKSQIRSAEDVKDTEHSNLPLDGGDRLDDEDATKTMDALKKGLLELSEKRKQAEADGDQRALAECDQQFALFNGELKKLQARGKTRSKTSGKGGRARTAVSNSIDRAINSIEGDNPSLAAHLKASISKGYKIMYSPALEINWILS